MNFMEQIAASGIVPVVVLDEVSQAVPTARALLAGGIRVMEITFRTAAARDSIAAVAREVPEMLVGAGTVVNLTQLNEALEAGARFIVSPGSDGEIIKAALDQGVPMLPGVVTPSELLVGLNLGLTVFKFFPAENYGGLKTINALGGPFPGVSFLPTGGISEKNAAEYFQNPRVLAVGGSWMVSGTLIREGRYDEITAKSAEAMALFHSIRG